MPRTARDRSLVSDESWEIETIHRKFPKQTHEAVEKAVADCKKNLGGSESREKIMECLESKLR